MLLALGISFRDPALLEQALTHKSYLNEHALPELQSNERLEFLGDAILGAVTAEALYRAFPTATEGALTVMRASVVCAPSLARWARRLDLGRQIILGRGEELGGGRERDSVLSGALEAIMGAIYLDQGYAAVQAVLAPFLQEVLAELSPDQPRLDAKSRLQQATQARFATTPIYSVVEVSGPQHRPTFTVEVRVGELVARASGPSKQAAEQEAARAMLEQLPPAPQGAVPERQSG